MMAGKIASMFGLEGGHMIGSRLSVLRQLFNLGIRYMTVTHYCNTPWADQAQADDPELSHLIRNNGLSSFGKDVIREMNRLGIIVDLSHVSRATMLDTLEVTKTPVIFSHSCARNLTYHIRNVPDDVLEKVKVNGGAVCVSFVPVFVKENIETEGNADVGDVADHFDYIRNKIGAEHLCIGGDYNGVSSLPDGLEDVGTVYEANKTNYNLMLHFSIQIWWQSCCEGDGVRERSRAFCRRTFFAFGRKCTCLRKITKTPSQIQSGCPKTNSEKILMKHNAL